MTHIKQEWLREKFDEYWEFYREKAIDAIDRALHCDHADGWHTSLDGEAQLCAICGAELED